MPDNGSKKKKGFSSIVFYAIGGLVTPSTVMFMHVKDIRSKKKPKT
jgi:hypothetical protein